MLSTYGMSIRISLCAAIADRLLSLTAALGLLRYGGATHFYREDGSATSFDFLPIDLCHGAG